MTITQWNDSTKQNIILQQQQFHQQHDSDNDGKCAPLLSLLQHKHIKRTNEKRTAIISDGICNLHVILDFDHTLTSYLDENGDVCLECHDMIYHGPLCTKEPNVGNTATRNDLYNASLHSDLTALENDRKTGALPLGKREWWDRFHESMVRNRVSKNDIKASVQLSNTILRPGAVEILDWLRRYNVKTTIVSAGITDIITEFLKSYGLLYDNVTIVANVLVWGEEDVIIGWREPLIYSRNKAEVLRFLGYGNSIIETKAGYVDKAEEESTHCQNNPVAPNVILAGNSIGDSKCLEGVNHNHSLAFGFLHTLVEEKNQTYSDQEKGGRNDGQDIVLADTTSSPPRQFQLTKEGDKELERFLDHYDVVSCGYDTDFQYLLGLFKEMEMKDKK